MKEKLLSDGNIEYIDERIEILIQISSKGVDFIDNGGYQELEKRDARLKQKEELEIRLIKSTLTANWWTKFGIVSSIVFSIVALAISIVAIITN